MPADVRAAAASAARERNLPAGQFAIVNTRSAVDPVLTFADNRALRERVWRAFVGRGDNGNANDTNQIIAQIVRIRADRARLLGYQSHAHWRMQDTMARTPERAQELMMRVWPAAVARVHEEVRDQQAMARPARPEHHHRALGLSLLHGEGAGATATTSPRKSLSPISNCRT